MYSFNLPGLRRINKLVMASIGGVAVLAAITILAASPLKASAQIWDGYGGNSLNYSSNTSYQTSTSYNNSVNYSTSYQPGYGYGGYNYPYSNYYGYNDYPYNNCNSGCGNNGTNAYPYTNYYGYNNWNNNSWNCW